MARIELAGQGEPIPIYAIPPFGSESVIPSTVLTFTDNDSFLTQQYRDLGYTHFEAWCIGAAGGRGGGVSVIDPTDTGYGVGVIPSTSYGGEGGGGGLHKIGGLLEELPPIVPVVVGREGAAGQDGNRHYRWQAASAMQDFGGVPMLLAVVKGTTNIPFMTDAAGNAIYPYFYSEFSPYLFYPNPLYIAPQDGADGGASTFNAPLGQASGGKGGRRSPVYGDNRNDGDRVSYAMQHAPGGQGGQGGTGGRILPGGGGDGGTASDLEFFDTPGGPFPPGYNYRDEKPRVLTSAKDGGWDGVIGKGGGGGRGGTFEAVFSGDPRFGTLPPKTVPASSGGKGSFSYGDTSVYGPAGSVGTLTITPGTAGGARVLKNLKYGSRSIGYNPNGVVVVRLTRIV